MAVDLTFLQATPSTADLTTYTFSSQNLGTAATDRLIVVTVAARGSTTNTVSSVTVGGVSATIHAQIDRNNTHCSAIATAAVPTGTTGDVVVTFADGMLRAGIALYRVTGSSGVTDTDAVTGAGTTWSVDVPNDGAGIGVSSLWISADDIDWTGDLGTVEDYEQLLESAIYHSGVSETFTTNGGTKTGTATSPTWAQQNTACIIALGPSSTTYAAATTVVVVSTVGTGPVARLAASTDVPVVSVVASAAGRVTGATTTTVVVSGVTTAAGMVTSAATTTVVESGASTAPVTVTPATTTAPAVSTVTTAPVSVLAASTTTAAVTTVTTAATIVAGPATYPATTTVAVESTTTTGATSILLASTSTATTAAILTAAVAILIASTTTPVVTATTTAAHRFGSNVPATNPGATLTRNLAGATLTPNLAGAEL